MSDIKIKLEEIATVHVMINEPIIDLKNESVSKVMIPFSGTVSGPYLNGVILPGGIDTQTIDSSNIVRLSARYIVQLDDGEKVFIENNGVMYGIGEGKYFKCIPTFVTSSKQYSWLNTDIFVGTVEETKSGIDIIIYRCI